MDRCFPVTCNDIWVVSHCSNPGIVFRSLNGVLCHAVKRVGGSNFLCKCYKCYKLWMSPRSGLRFFII
jgi:hypothetical protein